jgi:hypothetical protein
MTSIRNTLSITLCVDTRASPTRSFFKYLVMILCRIPTRGLTQNDHSLQAGRGKAWQLLIRTKITCSRKYPIVRDSSPRRELWQCTQWWAVRNQSSFFLMRLKLSGTRCTCWNAVYKSRANCTCAIQWWNLCLIQNWFAVTGVNMHMIFFVFIENTLHM